VGIGRKLGFVGAGNMGAALIKGLLRTGAAVAGDIVASARRPERMDELRAQFGIRTADNVTVAREADVIVLAVKPQAMDKVLREIAPVVDRTKLVLSVAAGVPVAAIERRLHPPARIVRAMPNTPALVRTGATAFVANEGASARDRALARTLFEGVGLAWEAPSEALLDAVTGLSGSGPAYVFVFLEALSDAGVRMGLPRDAASALAVQTVLGAAKLAQETGRHPAALKDQVTSPGGTTSAGLERLEAHGFRAAVHEAVAAATRRSRELGGG